MIELVRLAARIVRGVCAARNGRPRRRPSLWLRTSEGDARSVNLELDFFCRHPDLSSPSPWRVQRGFVAAAERRDLEPTPFDIQRQYVEDEEEAESPLAV